MTKNKVLIPLDEADFTLQIVPCLFQYLTPEENEVALLYVAEPAASPIAVGVTLPTTAPIESDNQTSFDQEVQPYVRAFQHAGFAVSTAVRIGEPLQEILKYIQAEAVSLVAMSTCESDDRRAKAKPSQAGRTAYQMLQATHVPVMLVHCN